MKNRLLRPLGVIGLAVILLVTVLLGSSMYAVHRMDKLAASVSIGDTKEKVENALNFLVQENVPLETYRFIEDDLLELVEEKSEMFTFTYKGDSAPFFVLVFNSEGRVTHKYVPGI